MNTPLPNRLLIKLLPYAILISFLLIKLNELSFYNSIGILSIILFIISTLTIRGFKIKPYTVYLLLFGIYVIFSDVVIASKKFEFYGMILKNHFFFFFCFANIIENLHISRKELKSMINPLLITVVLSFVVIIVQQVSDPMFLVRPVAENLANLDMEASEIRLSSMYTYSSIGDMALYFVPISALLISYFFKTKKVKLAITVVVLTILTTFLSKSRGVLSTALPLLLLIYLGRVKNYSAKKALTTLFFIVLISFPLGWLSEQLKFNAIIQDRILETSKGDFENKTAYTRIIAIQAFAECYPDAPFFGVGNTKYGVGGKGSWNYKLDSFLAGRSSQIHIGLLALFYLYGAVGAFFFIMFCYKLLRRVYIVSKYTHFWGTFWGLMVLPIMNLSMDWFDPFSAGILLCIVFNKYLENQIAQNNLDELFSKTNRRQIPARAYPVS